MSRTSTVVAALVVAVIAGAGVAPLGRTHAQQSDLQRRADEAAAHYGQQPWHDARGYETAAHAGERELQQFYAQQREREAHRAEVLAAEKADEAAYHQRYCAESFPERLADAKRALTEYFHELAAYKKNPTAQKIAWFLDHCRQLSPLEIAIRKLDDPDAFVCDPKAKGRPKGLSSATPFEEAPDPPSLPALQSFHTENEQCHDLDAADRFALGMTGDETDREDVVTRLLVLCYGDNRPSCVKARASIAPRAKQAPLKSTAPQPE